MAKITKAIILQSYLNKWIDLCIIPSDEKDIDSVEEIAQRAYGEWFERETDEPIVDYIKKELDNAGFVFDVYYNPEEDEYEEAFL
jgi:hypothetical protein